MIIKIDLTYSLLTWLKLLLIGIFGLSYQFFNTIAYSYAPSSKVGCLTFSSIIFASIIGYFKFSEKPDAFAIIGACLIISASIFTILYKEKSIFIKGN